MHNPTIILYYMGLNETMFFRVDKRDGHGFDTHGNQWRMINGKLQYWTGNRFEIMRFNGDQFEYDR